jgi:hypothetical protein
VCQLQKELEIFREHELFYGLDNIQPNFAPWLALPTFLTYILKLLTLLRYLMISQKNLSTLDASLLLNSALCELHQKYYIFWRDSSDNCLHARDYFTYYVVFNMYRCG